MLESPETRATFISSSVTFLRTHGFDGINLNFEFPINIDKYKFSALVMVIACFSDFDFRLI